MKLNKIKPETKSNIAINLANAIKNNIPIAATMCLISIGHDALIKKLSNPTHR